MRNKILEKNIPSLNLYAMEIDHLDKNIPVSFKKLMDLNIHVSKYLNIVTPLPQEVFNALSSLQDQVDRAFKAQISFLKNLIPKVLPLVADDALLTTTLTKIAKSPLTIQAGPRSLVLLKLHAKKYSGREAKNISDLYDALLVMQDDS